MPSQKESIPNLEILDRSATREDFGSLAPYGARTIRGSVEPHLRCTKY